MHSLYYNDKIVGSTAFASFRVSDYQDFKKVWKKGIAAILLSVFLCIIIAIPYFTRNAIQTGWLIYPFTGIDLFHFSWKIPYETALSDANEITVYGRGFTDVSMIGAAFGEWFPAWFSKLSLFNKIMLSLDGICFPVFLGCVGYYVTERIKGTGKRLPASENAISNVFHLHHRRSVSLSDFLFIEGISYIALLYFICTSPLVRYGCVYLWLPAVMLIGRFVILLDNAFDNPVKNYIYKCAIVIFAAFMAFKFGVLIRDDIPRFRLNNLVTQQPYNSYSLKEKQINGQTFYYPEEGDRTGYDPFPSTPNPDGFRMAGEKIIDGFLPPAE